VVLASHAAAALDSGRDLTLPGHPAFLVVRRARLTDWHQDGDVAAWFERVREDGGPVRLADAGVDDDPIVATTSLAWDIEAGGSGVAIVPTSPGMAAIAERHTLDEATQTLRAAAVSVLDAAGTSAPPLWSDAVRRAIAILESRSTGEELSDVAWPHLVLPSSFPLPARRLAAAAATLWLWEGPGAWSGEDAGRAHALLHAPVASALEASVSPPAPDTPSTS
jgi:hypothetical protein